MDLFNNDGSINTESVSEVVQKDILLIKNNLDNSEYQELTAQIRSAYVYTRYDEILRLIFILSILAQHRLPTTARLYVNSSLFHVYCKLLTERLVK
jgi:hypothetical protein